MRVPWPGRGFCRIAIDVTPRLCDRGHNRALFGGNIMHRGIPWHEPARLLTAGRWQTAAGFKTPFEAVKTPFVPRRTVHIRLCALVIGSRLDLTWVLRREAIRLLASVPGLCILIPEIPRYPTFSCKGMRVGK